MPTGWSTVLVTAVVEGTTDEPVVRAVLLAAGWREDEIDVRVARGSGVIDSRLHGYARAAVHAPWVVFRDTDGQCPVDLRGELLGSVDPAHADAGDESVHESLFRLRLVETEIESWLLADPIWFAAYFRVPEVRARRAMKAQDAKAGLLGLIHNHCADRRLREGVVREDRRGRLVFGDGYVAGIREFVARQWDPQRASENNSSLRRAFVSLSDLESYLRSRGTASHHEGPPAVFGF